jgi:hypothetical protein
LGSFEGKISSFELLIFTSAEGSINRTQSTAEAARWSNCPGRHSTARKLLPPRSHESVTASVTTSPKTL